MALFETFFGCRGRRGEFCVIIANNSVKFARKIREDSPVGLPSRYFIRLSCQAALRFPSAYGTIIVLNGHETARKLIHN